MIAVTEEQLLQLVALTHRLQAEGAESVGTCQWATVAPSRRLLWHLILRVEVGSDFKLTNSGLQK